MKRPRGSAVWLIVLAGLTIGTLILAQAGYLEAVEGVAFRFFAPLERWFTTLGRGFSNLVQTASDLRDLRERNSQLAELARQLIVENVRLKEVEAENIELRRLLDFVGSSTGREFKASEVRLRVVGREPTSLFQYILIDGGSDDGLAVGMPVVTEDGLVGRIETVYPRVSRVRLIIDAGSSVNALVQRSRADGIVKGQVGGRLVLEYLPQGEDIVSIGDYVLTSGLGGGYPRQIMIGQVTQLSRKDYEMFQRAEVRPAVNFSRLQFVLVITNFTALDVSGAGIGIERELPAGGNIGVSPQ